MTGENPQDVSSDELDWSEAVVREGRQPGAVVSVRLDPAEASRLRGLADELGLNVSQVIRRALAEYQSRRRPAAETPVFLQAFTYGGTALPDAPRWHVVRAQLQLGVDEETVVEGPRRTATEPIQIEKRVRV